MFRSGFQLRMTPCGLYRGPDFVRFIGSGNRLHPAVPAFVDGKCHRNTAIGAQKHVTQPEQRFGSSNAEGWITAGGDAKSCGSVKLPWRKQRLFARRN